MLLITVKEVVGNNYHLANGKVIEVTEEEAERLQALYPDSFKKYVYLKPAELLEKLGKTYPPTPSLKGRGETVDKE